MNALSEKFKEVSVSIIPITLIVLILNFTIAPMETSMVIRFVIGAIFIVIGLSVFLLGVDIGITPIGSLMGSALTKSNKMWILVMGGFVIGLLISIAEPDLQILADEVAHVTSGQISKMSIVIVVSIGIAFMLSIGLFRIVRNISLKKLLTVIYLVIFVLALFVTPEFLAISFDASGATTGAMTVPFILAVALGVSHLKKDSLSNESDSFGLVAIASSGAIIAVMLMCIITDVSEVAGEADVIVASSQSIILPFIDYFKTVFWEVVMALLPVLILFLVCQKITFKLGKRPFGKILKGLIYTFIGLVIFLVGVNAGFMEVGREVGYKLASMDNKAIVVIIGFILGLVTILAEPAVYVLTNQIEDVTSGYVKRSLVLPALAIGVGFAVALSMIRIIIPGIQLWHYLLPGYAIAIGMMYIVPDLFIGMAFDSGGVASGPMTATFILAYTQGTASAIEGANVLVDGFGMIAMVALMPIVALQALGLLFKIKSRKGGLNTSGE